jgi:hypothetical protein
MRCQNEDLAYAAGGRSEVVRAVEWRLVIVYPLVQHAQSPSVHDKVWFGSVQKSFGQSVHSTHVGCGGGGGGGEGATEELVRAAVCVVDLGGGATEELVDGGGGVTGELVNDGEVRRLVMLVVVTAAVEG